MFLQTDPHKGYSLTVVKATFLTSFPPPEQPDWSVHSGHSRKNCIRVGNFSLYGKFSLEGKTTVPAGAGITPKEIWLHVLPKTVSPTPFTQIKFPWLSRHVPHRSRPY